ncbi:uncharacterized protein LOC114293087 isoform X5 [Camellia sinensis]|uniref:uncharacterized protein LOC114293087 isoform X5 n=1 Tax=Camellia sinensis TaxID=4442 RepID=UPI0010366E14|nr:uncharacterized protein LOC114293087 isoform X5 [Camellia sinensis]XP_028092928.1 uncharacterized protein LOC114293087 isoform X5 [Camellia sinensis]
MMTELKRSILDVVLFIDSHINPAKSKLAFQNLLPHYYDSLMSNATIKQANWDSSKVRTKLRQELRDEIRDELREEMWAELSTQIQQVKVEMLVIVSQEGSTNHNKQVLDALSGHREPTDYEADENPHTPPPDDAVFFL